MGDTGVKSAGSGIRWYWVQFPGLPLTVASSQAICLQAQRLSFHIWKMGK